MSTRFVLRYVNAIEQYLEKLIHNEDDVEDILQQLLVKVLENGFARATPDRGRFRFYLIRVVKNEVITWQRNQSRLRTVSVDRLAEPASEPSSSEDWDQGWQQCLLDRSWMQLRQHEHEHPGNLCHTVLRAATEHPQATSDQLAQQISALTGQTLSAAAYRKQLSRARRLFAEYTVKEVSETLDQPSPDEVKQELAELGLMKYVREFMPSGW